MLNFSFAHDVAMCKAVECMMLACKTRCFCIWSYIPKIELSRESRRSPIGGSGPLRYFPVEGVAHSLCKR